MYQVQIFVSDVGEWYGWAHGEDTYETKKAASIEERRAKRYGWTTRVVKVK